MSQNPPLIDVENLFRQTEPDRSEKLAAGYAPKSALETESEIARDHSDHDGQADDVKSHCVARIEASATCTSV
jgi:hypothetical protein